MSKGLTLSHFPYFPQKRNIEKKHMKKRVSNEHLHSFPVPGMFKRPCEQSEQKLRVNCMDSISRMQLEISTKLMYLYIKIPQLSTMM